MATDRLAANFERTLRRQVEALERFIAELVAELDTEGGRVQTTRQNLERAVLMRQRITDRLNALGFQAGVRDLYAGLADVLEAEAGGSAERLAVAESTLASFASNLTRNLDNAWFTMTGQIQQAVEQAALTNAPVGELILGLAGPGRASIRLTADLGAPLASWLNWASSAVETSLAGLVRQIQILEATEAGVTFFVYRGTSMATTRPFCRLMQGVVVRLEDLRAIDTDPELRHLRALRDKDGRQPPIIPSLGGWRCRHTLTATSLRDAKADGRRIFMDEAAAIDREAEALL